LAFGLMMLLPLVAANGQEEDAAAAAAQARATASEAIDREATRLEAELGKYRDTTPEAGDALFKLTKLYHQHARVFGLLRAAQRFVAAQTNDDRHAEVMLMLLDGLESLSRHQQFADRKSVV
jgi:hypothetical protein